MNGTKVKWEEYDRIANNNAIWQKVDSMLIEKYPDIRIIDIDEKELVSAECFPYGVSPSHLSQDYYRKMWLEYNKLFVHDYFG